MHTASAGSIPSARALHQAGLAPIKPFAADDNALTSSDAYSTALWPCSSSPTPKKRWNGPI